MMGQTEDLGQRPGQQVSLVVATFLMTVAMQRHGNDHVGRHIPLLLYQFRELLGKKIA
ncbi:MAG: hypothetical protein NVS9B4_23540 [Candidatus Acidiferrum sp.]